MKRIILLCLVMIACSTHTTPVKQVKQEIYIDTTANQEQQYQHEKYISEEAKYESSLARIEFVFRKEGKQYQECLDVNKKKSDCDELLKQLCTIDVFLDTHGEHYQKPYCK